MLASIDRGSDADRIITESGAGVVVAPDDAKPFIQALGDLLANPVHLDSLGQKAQGYVGQLMTPDQQAEAYELLFAQLSHR